MEIIGEKNHNEKDPGLWRIAQKRAAFKKHAGYYLVINLMLWCIYWFSGHGSRHWGIPWPAWVSLFWGIGIILRYFEAYHGTQNDIAEREYEKLKKEKDRGV